MTKNIFAKIDDYIMDTTYLITRWVLVIIGSALVVLIPITMVIILPVDIYHYFENYDIRWLKEVGEDILIVFLAIVVGRVLQKLSLSSSKKWQEAKKYEIKESEDDSLDIDKVNKIVQDYGKIMETVSNENLTKYPSLSYPISLLPYPKEQIKKALDLAIVLTNGTKDKQYTIGLQSGLVMLDRFIPDNEANEANNKLLSSNEWQKALKKKAKSS